LKFSVEYVGRYVKTLHATSPQSATEIDIEVEDIDTKELMEDCRFRSMLTHHSVLC